MMLRILTATLSAAALCVSTTLSSFAWTGEVEGLPALGTAEVPEDELTLAHLAKGYYVWHDEDGWHVRTHGPEDEHLFEARLRTDGVFYNPTGVRLEPSDGYLVLDDGHTLVVRFHTYRGIDGVDFHIAGGDRLGVSLHLDGKLISTDSIYLGAQGVHPEDNPFVITR